MTDTTTTTTAGDTEGLLVAEFEKNGRETVRVRLTEYRGVPLVDVRSFYQAKGAAGDEWRPGKGISLRRELLPALLDALQAAEVAARGTDRGAND